MKRIRLILFSVLAIVFLLFGYTRYRSQMARASGVSLVMIAMFNEAIPDLDRAIFFNSRNASAYYFRGLAKFELKQYEDAIADYEKSVKLGYETKEALNQIGLAYQALGDESKAQTHFEKARQSDPP